MIYEKEIAFQKEHFEKQSDFLLDEGRKNNIDRQSAEDWIESALPKIFSKKILFDRDLKEAIKKMRDSIDVNAVADELAMNPLNVEALAEGMKAVNGIEKSDGIILWRTEGDIDQTSYAISLTRLLEAFGWTVLPILCGSSELTSSVTGLLRYIAYHLEEWCQIEHTDLETMRPWACRQYCDDLIDLLVEKKPGIRHCILIDGLDLLKNASSKDKMDFLPSKIGMYFRMLVTVEDKEAEQEHGQEYEQAGRKELTSESCYLQQDEVDYLKQLIQKEEARNDEIPMEYIQNQIDIANLEMKLESVEYGNQAYMHFTNAKNQLEILQKQHPGQYETKLVYLGACLLELFIKQFTSEYDYEQVYQWAKLYAEQADKVCPENQKANHLNFKMTEARYFYLKGQTKEADQSYQEAYQMLKEQIGDLSKVADLEALLALGVERYERRMRRDTSGQWESDPIFTEVRDTLRGQDSYHKNEEWILLDCRYRYEEANGWFVEFQREKNVAVKCQHLNNALVALEESQIMLNHLILETNLERANYLLVKIKARYAYILMHAGMQYVRQPKDGASQALIIGIDILQNTDEQWKMPGSDKLLERMTNMLQRL